MDNNKLLELLGYGRDFAQGASNAAASTVSAPVDGLAWLMRKAGVPVGDEPMGGSEWMRRRQLTAEPQNKLAGLLGESFGGVAPMLATAKAPQIARGLLDVVHNAETTGSVFNKQRGGLLNPLPSQNYAVQSLDVYTPNLYRQSSLDEAEQFMPGSSSSGQPMDYFFANEPAHALGQGKNAGGALMEFDAKGLPGQIDLRKPASQLAYKNGTAEFISRQQNAADLSGNLKSLQIDPTQDARYAKRIETLANQLGWLKSVADDGRITYRRP